jgi:hypothetical protein
MLSIGRGKAAPLAERAVRLRNACLHDLAQRTGLPAPESTQLENVAGTANLADAWDWWCAVCVREPVVGELAYGYSRRPHVPLLLRASVVTVLIVLALAITASPAGS